MLNRSIYVSIHYGSCLTGKCHYCGIINKHLLLEYHGKNVLGAISTNENDGGPIPNRVYHDGHGGHGDRDVMIGVQHVLRVSQPIMWYRHRVLVLQCIHAMPRNATIAPNIRTAKMCANNKRNGNHHVPAIIYTYLRALIKLINRSNK